MPNDSDNPAVRESIKAKYKFFPKYFSNKLAKYMNFEYFFNIKKTKIYISIQKKEILQFMFDI